MLGEEISHVDAFNNTFRRSRLYAAGPILAGTTAYSGRAGVVRHPVGTRPCQIGGMDEYFIGAGALLTAGPQGSIVAATLHAQTGCELAGKVVAAVVDFESVRESEISRLLIVAAGWSGGRFQAEVVRKLVARGECALADVIAILSEATGAPEIHLFARWLPDEGTLRRLSANGIRVSAYPLEAIGQAALVSGQRVARWRSPVRAA